jgi:hypothetical protein
VTNVYSFARFTQPNFFRFNRCTNSWCISLSKSSSKYLSIIEIFPTDASPKKAILKHVGFSWERILEIKFSKIHQNQFVDLFFDFKSITSRVFSHEFTYWSWVKCYFHWNERMYINFLHLTILDFFSLSALHTAFEFIGMFRAISIKALISDWKQSIFLENLNDYIWHKLFKFVVYFKSISFFKDIGF